MASDSLKNHQSDLFAVTGVMLQHVDVGAKLQLYWTLFIIYVFLIQRLKKGLKPTPDWGPAEAEYRALYNYPDQETVCMAPLVCMKNTRQYHVNSENLHMQEKNSF